MGTQAEHVAKWKHNRALLKVVPDSHCDWMVTVAFYTAIHAVEALFAKDGITHNNKHTGEGSRNDRLKGAIRYQTIWRSYRPLFDASVASRYDCFTTTQTTPWMDLAAVKNRFVLQNLVGVENLVIRLLTLPRGDFPPPIEAVQTPSV